VDDKAIEGARENIARNQLSDDITLIQTLRDGSFFPPAVLECHAKIDVVLCNPPFYSNQEHIESLHALKSTPARTSCQASETEMITTGGEVAFVLQYARESLAIKDRVGWMTAWLGLKQDAIELKRLLAESLGAQKVEWTPLYQGQTVRYALAWQWPSISE
jgi:23S rRNA A1618 N6-methylase RlmF